MVAFMVGTTAEAIKVSPVIRELATHGEVSTIWWTGMHGPIAPELLIEQGLDSVSVRRLHSPNRVAPLARPLETAAWMGEVLIHVNRARAEIRNDMATGPGQRRLLMVHGDTITTALGSAIGRGLGATVAHIEAGLRSHSLRHPFPEEANRRVAGRLADIHFAPSLEEVRNLQGCRGVVIDTGENTAIDALRFALGDARIEPGGFGLATLHRFELVHDQDRFREALGWLRQEAERKPILYYGGASDLLALKTTGLISLFDDRLVLLPKLSHSEFVKQVANADFVVTDSGGLQEECAYLGVPALIHRARTERSVGVGQNVVLSRFQKAVWDSFFHNYQSLRRSPIIDRFHPSLRIVDFLQSAGFLSSEPPADTT